MLPKTSGFDRPNNYAEVTCLCGRGQLEPDRFLARPGCTSLLLSEVGHYRGVGRKNPNANRLLFYFFSPAIQSWTTVSGSELFC